MSELAWTNVICTALFVFVLLPAIYGLFRVGFEMDARLHGEHPMNGRLKDGTPRPWRKDRR